MSISFVQRCNLVLALFVALAIGAASCLPFLRVAPNRLLSGEPAYLWEVLQQQGSPLVFALMLANVALLCFAVWQPKRRVIQALVYFAMAASLTGIWKLAGQFASNTISADNPLTQTTLGAGFWTLGAMAWMIALDSIDRLQLTTLRRLFLQSSLLLPLFFSLNEGQHLSIAKEYANQSDVFWPAVLRHIQIVFLAVVPALAISFLLAWRMTKTQSFRQALFPVLNFIQTIPSIALFGILMMPLAWIAVQMPALGRAGISGVGIAPAVIALFMYALLPIVRSALAGLEQVPAEAIHAARAMGMTAGQLLWQVELPLALPVLLIGLRTAVVQTTGLAAVSALVGAGGLGQIMFDGLFSAANELVILGVIPIVLLAILADTFFKLLSSFITIRP